MKTIRIGHKETTECTIVYQNDAFRKKIAPMRENFLHGGGMIVTDANVYAIYRKKMERYLGGVPIYVMPAGERNKNEQTLFALLKNMKDVGLRRNSTLIAIGGGVVGDLGGLAASLYMRGIDLIQVPTTLLAQVDSSIGGKTAVDLGGVKNLIGAFKQPSRVYTDPVFLRTLPRRELRGGLGEIVKHGALSAPLFEKLCSAKDVFDLDFLEEIVPENIALKADIVRRDPLETGLRKCLNLGHTTGHAIELSTSLTHGECILWGIILETLIAERYLDIDQEFRRQLFDLIYTVLGTTRTPMLHGLYFSLLDKKNTASDKVTLTVPVALEKWELLELTYAQYEKDIREVEGALQ